MRSWVWSQAPHKPGVMVHVCTSSTGEVETGGWEIKGHPKLHSKFEASMGYMKHHLSIKMKCKTKQKRKERPVTHTSWSRGATCRALGVLCSPWANRNRVFCSEVHTLALCIHRSEPLTEQSRSAGGGAGTSGEWGFITLRQRPIPPMHSAACIGLVYTACLEGPMLYPIDGQCQRHECLLLRQGELSQTIFSLFKARVPARLFEVP